MQQIKILMMCYDCVNITPDLIRSATGSQWDFCYDCRVQIDRIDPQCILSSHRDNRVFDVCVELTVTLSGFQKMEDVCSQLALTLDRLVNKNWDLQDCNGRTVKYEVYFDYVRGSEKADKGL